ncbi:hypothetical protein LINPERHAP1_LOCUS32352 [Linum perenne]
MMTTTSFIFLLAFILTNTLQNDVVIGDPNVTFVDSYCGWPYKEDDQKRNERMRNATMDAIDEAVFHYQGPGEKASCSSSKNHFAASAMCWGDISFEDCRNCLWNAQYRLVEHYCRSRSAGLLILTNCFLRFDYIPFCNVTNFK